MFRTFNNLAEWQKRGAVEIFTSIKGGMAVLEVRLSKYFHNSGQNPFRSVGFYINIVMECLL